MLASFEVTRDQADQIATFSESLDGRTRTGGYDYDAGGRLTGVQWSDGVESVDSTFVLDAAGNREAVTGDGAQAAVFNELDQLTSAGAVSYGYDASGFLTSITDASGTTDLSWTAGGRLTALDGPGGAVSYGYDPAGVLVSRTDGAGTVGFVNDPPGVSFRGAGDRAMVLWRRQRGRDRNFRATHTGEGVALPKSQAGGDSRA